MLETVDYDMFAVPGNEQSGNERRVGAGPGYLGMSRTGWYSQVGPGMSCWPARCTGTSPPPRAAATLVVPFGAPSLGLFKTATLAKRRPIQQENVI